MKKYLFVKRWHFRLRMPALIVRAMRITIFLTLACVVNLYATGYSQKKLTLSLKDVKLSQVFNVIQQRTHYQFLYNDEDIQGAPLVNVIVKEATVPQILAICFTKNYPLEYRIEDSTVVVLKKPAIPYTIKIPSHIGIPQFTVNGRVTDSLGNPLIGVSVSLRGTSTGTITDASGNYSLILESGNGILVFSYVGFSKKEVAVNGRSTINVSLTSATTGLNQLVVVGYGTQKKKTVTGAISTVGTKELVETPVSNVGNALVGRVPGLMATQGSGEPGHNAATIRIRGVSTLNGSGQSPLIVIDGIQSDISVMNSLDPHNIESISVLKDASATAVYGVRGANGVIIVTTKRGRAGKPKISFSANYGITQLTSKLNMLDSYHYALFRNEAIHNDGDPSFDQYLFTKDELWKFKHNRDYTPAEVAAMDLTPEQKAALNASPALYYSSHNYYEEQFGNTAPQQQYNLNISGGGERVRYFTSVGYFSQKGIFTDYHYGGNNMNSYYKRYNFRSNYDIDVIRNLQISVNLSGQVTTDGGILGKDGDIHSPYSRHKEMTVIILAGTPYAGPGIIDGHLIGGFVNNTNPLGAKGGGGVSPATYFLTRPFSFSSTTHLNTTVKIKHTMDYLTKGLSVHGTVSYSDRYTKGTYSYHPVPQYTVMRNPDNPAELLFFGGAVGPETVTDNYNNNKWHMFYLEGAVNYNRSFGKHAVTGLVLFNAQKTYDPNLRYNLPSGLMGLASRVTYNYNYRYLAEFDMGYNGSENFPPGSRFGFFPAFSAGWIISNEKFFPENKWVTWLKVRGSYGEVGNDKVAGRRFLYLPSTWGYGAGPMGGYYFGNSNGGSKDPFYTGASETTVGNPDVTWERAKKTNIGLEIRFLKDRLSFTGDVFREKRDNILWPLGTVPALVAANLPPANIGKVSNHGYELQLGWNDHIGQIDYYIKGNVSYARNKIEYEDEPSYPYKWMNETGFQLGQFKGLYTSGFYNNAKEVNNRPYSSVDGNKVQAGDLRYVDINGDGKIDPQDNVPIGYANLPQYAFNWSLGLSYKGFNISVLFIGTAKGSFPLTSFYMLNPFYQTSGAAMHFQYDSRWTPEKAAKGITPTFPRASVRNFSTQNGVMNDFWLKSTDFIRLKNAEISYTFNQPEILKHIGVTGIKVYANGNNLYTWDHLIDGIDPEQQDSGGASSGYLYPMTRIYNFGINIQF